MDFLDSAVFAFIMTAIEDLKEDRQREDYIEDCQRRLDSLKIGEAQILNDIVLQKNKLLKDVSQIIIEADDACNIETDSNPEDWVSLLTTSVVYKRLNEINISNEERIGAFNRCFSAAGLNPVIAAEDLFAQSDEEISDALEKALRTIIKTLIIGSTKTDNQRFVDFSEAAIEFFNYLDAIIEFKTGKQLDIPTSKLLMSYFIEIVELCMKEGSDNEVDPEKTERSNNLETIEERKMAEMNLGEQYNDIPLNARLRSVFDGKIVRKDLTKSIKEGANVPVYVLEFLLGQYCSSEDPEIIEAGVNNVKKILSDNFVRPDEAQKVLSKLRQNGSHTVIDKLTVSLNVAKDRYECDFSNLGITKIAISEEYPTKYDRLLCGGIWCIVQLEYEYVEEDKQNNDTIRIRNLTPIQMPHVDMDELKAGRSIFTKEEWMDIVLRSIGMEPNKLSYREKWLLLLRVIPLVENNFNLCELGPRSTGKSHIYKEISPNSILVSGGQTTVANLFYNMAKRQVGLVGLWDCVAFDEVAGINFKDKDGIQIMKDYMASGSFARGKEEKAASASMVFVGNINQSVDVLLKTSSLFDPFPPEMGTDTAFLDRMHCYIPGWEIPKFRPEHFTDDYGFITDYFSEFVRELRKEQYGDALDRYFKLGKNLNQRDTIAVRKIVGGLLKLIYPNGEFDKEEVREILVIALEMRRRVKEQLKKLGGMEFYDVNFSYIDNETFEENFVSVPEQGGSKLIPEGICKPGQIYTVSQGKSGMIGLFRLESQMMPGRGKFDCTGLGSERDAKEATNTAFNYLKANAGAISGNIHTTLNDFIINYQDMQGIGMTGKLALPTLIALCSIALNKPTVSSLAVIGEISIAGSIIKTENLADTLQVCLDSGAKKVLLPTSATADFASVPSELLSHFNLIFYNSAEDAVFKALGVE